MGVYSSSVFTEVRRRLHRLRKGERPITCTTTTEVSHRPSPPSTRLPPLSSRQRTPLQTLLPKIGQLQEADEGGTGEDTASASLTPLSSPSPDLQPPLPTPSPVFSLTNQEVPPGSGKRSTGAPSPVGSAGDEEKTDYLQIVREMRGDRSTNKLTNTTVDTKITLDNFTGAIINNTKDAATTDSQTNTTDDDTIAAIKLAATFKARMLLSQNSRQLPIDEFIEAGVLEAAKANLNKSSSDDLVYETAWVITNIASGTSDQTQAVAAVGLIEPLVSMAETGKAKNKEQAIWALSNIMADDMDLRNWVLEAGVLRPLIDCIRNHWDCSSDPFGSTLPTLTWALSNIFRLGNVQMEEEDITLTLNVLEEVCLASNNNQVLAETLWCLSRITQQDDLIGLVVKANLLPLMIPHLSSKLPFIQTAAMRVVGNVVTGTDEQTDAALEAGMLLHVHNVLKYSHSDNLRKEAAWILSNITAGIPTQIQRVLDEGALPTLLKVLDKDSYIVQKEAAWAVANLVQGGTDAQVSEVVEARAVPRLLRLLSHCYGDAATVFIVLDTLLNVLQKSENINKVKTQIDEAGVDKLSLLENHENIDIASKIQEILLTYEEDTVDTEEEKFSTGNGEERVNDNSLSEAASKLWLMK